MGVDKGESVIPDTRFKDFIMMSAPKCHLVSGLVVANFSSPHPFTFTDGRVLGGCDAERSAALSLEQREVEHAQNGWIDVKLTFEMSPAVSDELNQLNADPSIDIVLVPFPVMGAIKAAGLPIGKFRVCRTADRQTKVVFADKFCI